MEEVNDAMTGSYCEISEREDSHGEEENLEEQGSITLERPAKLSLGGLEHLEGTLTKHGEMISFVADGIEEKLRSPSSGGSAPGLTLICELERRAGAVATAVDSLVEHLADTLHGISALSADCVETYRDAVCKTCDTLDANIKSMYQLMAKCEELSKSMEPVHKLNLQIKNIKHLLDLFEGAGV